MTNTSPAVVTFGELLLRLDTPGYERLVQASEFGVSFTGGEANVAVALAQWGVPCRILSRVPTHEIGTACLNQFRRYGVDTQFVSSGGDRLGILFVETGASQRSSKVVYDRGHTSFRGIEVTHIDWDNAFANAGWFHFTGTAPAVSQQAHTVLQHAISEARSRGIPVSMDCSYRSALWSLAQAKAVLQPLLHSVDVLFGSEADASQFFDVPTTGEQCLRDLQQDYNLRCVAFTEREVSATGINTYSASLVNATDHATSPAYEIQVIDRIGAGDAFAAGVIYGLLHNHPLQSVTNTATATAVLAHTIPGDFLLASREEIEHIANGTNTARGWR